MDNDDKVHMHMYDILSCFNPCYCYIISRVSLVKLIYFFKSPFPHFKNQDISNVNFTRL